MAEELIREQRTIDPPQHMVDRALISDYEALYLHSITFPERFWESVAKELEWGDKWDKVMELDTPYHNWFVGSTTNICINALDRHARSDHRNKVALIWTTEDGTEELITYNRLLRRVCQIANGLKALGVEKGDRVLINMAVTPEAIATMLACARIGAIHCVVYAGMGVKSLRARIHDCKPKVVFTSDVTFRSGRRVPLKTLLDNAVEELDYIEKIIVHRRQQPQIALTSQREADFTDWMEQHDQWCEPEMVESSHPLFIMYTSGTTGKPKGIVHVHGGYMVGTYYFAKAFYDLQPSDIIWCTANIGWIVAHSFSVYGPMLNGATVLMREGGIDVPTPDAAWKTIERHGVNILYTAPTAIRKFMRYGEDIIKKFDTSTLRLIACSGQPLNPEAQLWAQEHILGDRGSIVDNWWQTELAGPIIGTLPGMKAKLAKVGKPMPGVVANIVDAEGHTENPNTPGRLVLRRPVPYMMSGVWNDDAMYRQYWDEVPNCYFTGDVAFYDQDGYFCVLGRADDVINVSGHSIRATEIEATLAAHPSVREAAVIGLPDELRGERIRAYVVLQSAQGANENVRQVLRDHVRRELGALTAPSEIEFKESLPKNQNGTLVRRILRAEAMGEDPGDTSTLRTTSQ